MTGTVILVIAICLALVSIRSLTIALTAAILAYVALPEVAAWASPLPGAGAVNPAALVVVLSAVVQVVLRPVEYATDALRTPVLSFALLIWVVGGTITNFLAAAPAIGSWIEIVLAPPLGFVLVRRLAALDGEGPRRLALVVIAASTAEALLALAIWAGLLPHPFDAAHQTFTYWWDPEFPRALGTSDSPLGLAALMLVATALLLVLRRNWLVIALGALFLATIVAAESRGALLVGAVVLTTVIVRRGVSFTTTLALLGAAVSIAMVVVITTPDLVAGLATKLADDNGSTNARVLGVTEGFPSTLSTPLVGNGYGAATATARDLGLGTSFENPLVMTALDWGLTGALAFLVAQAAAIARGTRGGAVPGSALAALALAVFLQTFSSYAIGSGAAVFLWLVLGLTTAPTKPSAPGDGTARADDESDGTTDAAEAECRPERPVLGGAR